MMINIDALREYLIDYYGSAVFAGFPSKMIDLCVIQSASAEELICIAQRENIDLSLFLEQESSVNMNGYY